MVHPRADHRAHPAPASRVNAGARERETDTEDALAPLWRRWRETGELQARDALITHYLSHARMVAATVYAQRLQNDVEFDDYLQWARLGMMEAIERFDPGHGVLFRSFAAKRIQGAILNGLAHQTERNQQLSLRARWRRQRVASLRQSPAPDHEENSHDADDDACRDKGDASAPSADEAMARAMSLPAHELFRELAQVGMGLAIGVLLEGTGMVDGDSFGSSAQVPGPEVRYFRQAELTRLRQLLQDQIHRLPQRHQRVIRLHYLQEMPFDAIARELDVAITRVYQLHQQALLRLRAALHKHPGVCDVSL